MRDYYEEKLSKSAPSYKCCFWAFIGMIAAILVASLFTGCKSIQYVPVETIRTEIKHIHDTVKIQDSIKHENQLIIREADSAEIARLNKEYGFRLDKAQRTILILLRELEQSIHNQSEVRDSIVYKDKEVQVPVPVEKKLTRWQQLKLDLGEIFIIITVVISSISITLLYLRRHRQRNI